MTQVPIARKAAILNEWTTEGIMPAMAEFLAFEPMISVFKINVKVKQILKWQDVKFTEKQRRATFSRSKYTGFHHPILDILTPKIRNNQAKNLGQDQPCSDKFAYVENC